MPQQEELPFGPAIASGASASAGAPTVHAPTVPPRGPCRACGADLVDWARVTRRDIADIGHTFEELRKERIRHYFWHIPFDEAAMIRARRKGRSGLLEAAAKRIGSSVMRDTGFDGRQTPMEGNVLFYAQHATAACCRKCIEEWHAIPRGRDLTENEMDYLKALILRYIDGRIPELSREPDGVEENAHTDWPGSD